MNARAFVIVATRGRSGETSTLLTWLARQSLRPERVVIVGVSQADLPMDAASPLRIDRIVSPVAGLTAQRNFGMDQIGTTALGDSRTFVTFFDDDFRPDVDWLKAAADAFGADDRLAGLSGTVLADGVNGQAVTDADAADYLDGVRSAQPHWSAGPPRSIESLYGCNMAVRGRVAAACRFDEALPLYGWQEDCDFAGQARRLGDTRLVPACRGVHLGVKSARSSGLRLGYSQIANPLRIWSRRNMTTLRLARFLARAVAANIVKSSIRPRRSGYGDRLRGNFLALGDLALGRCRPARILELDLWA